MTEGTIRVEFPIVKSDFTTLVQGPMDSRMFGRFEAHAKFGPLVVSYWNSNLTADGQHNDMTMQNTSNLVAVPHPEPPPMGEEDLTEVARGSTFYKAIASVYYGLQECKTKYVIKIRSDEGYSNLEPLIEKFLEDDNKMVCGNIFFKRWKQAPYHIGDHLFVAKTETLKKAYERLYKVYVLRNVEPHSHELQGPWSAEQILAHSFLIASGVDPADMHNKAGDNEPDPVEEVYLKYFDVVDIRTLGTYVATWKHCSKEFGNDEGHSPFNPQDWECINDMRDL